MSAVTALFKEVKNLRKEIAALENLQAVSYTGLRDKLKRQEEFIEDQNKRYKDMYEDMKGDVQRLREEKAWWKQ